MRTLYPYIAMVLVVKLHSCTYQYRRTYARTCIHDVHMLTYQMPTIAIAVVYMLLFLFLFPLLFLFSLSLRLPTVKTEEHKLNWKNEAIVGPLEEFECKGRNQSDIYHHGPHCCIHHQDETDMMLGA